VAIFKLAKIVDPPVTIQDQIGYELYQKCRNHFVNYFGQTGLNLSYDSCCAAVAVKKHDGYDKVESFDGFSIVYGCSRLYKGLDPDVPTTSEEMRKPFSSSPDEEHAEQTAILTAQNKSLALWTDADNICHIYVELNPCGGCETWLGARSENWYVHYSANLTVPKERKELIGSKKRKRKDEFGRIMEPKPKRRKLDD
jgi:hypothetical protein